MCSSSQAILNPAGVFLSQAVHTSYNATPRGKSQVTSGMAQLMERGPWSRYRIVLGKDDIKKHEGFLKELMRLAFEHA
jgi:hypothetical protein